MVNKYSEGYPGARHLLGSGFEGFGVWGLGGLGCREFGSYGVGGTRVGFTVEGVGVVGLRV